MNSASEGGFLSLSLLVVSPQVGAVYLGRPVVAGKGHERRGQRVLEIARDRDDLAVVIGGLAIAVLRAGNRLLRVEDRVVRVFVGRLVDGRVQVLRADQVALVR